MIYNKNAFNTNLRDTQLIFHNAMSPLLRIHRKTVENPLPGVSIIYCTILIFSAKEAGQIISSFVDSPN